MDNKTLVDIMDEVLEEVKGNVVKKVTGFAKDVKRHIKARKIVGFRASSRTYNAVVSELLQKEKEYDELMTRKENYCRYILLGLLDMIEAVYLRYDVLSPEEISEDILDKIIELFLSGKHRTLMYCKWLCLADGESFAKEWIPVIEPLRLDTFTTIDEWIDFFNNLPI